MLERDGLVCQVRVPGVCIGRATQVHHVRGKGISEDPANLLASCAPCNNKLGDPTLVDPAITPRTSW